MGTIVASAVLAPYLGSLSMGLLHGVEPGHGWPLTIRAAAGADRPYRHGLWVSLVMAAGHFLSTLVVVALFFLAASVLDLLQRPLLLIAGLLLVTVGVLPLLRRWWSRRRGEAAGHGHGHDHDHHHHHGHHHHDTGHGGREHGPHDHDATATTRGIFVSALILGFAHEEEVALIGFILAGGDALLVSLIYGAAVTAAIAGVTLLALWLARRRPGGLQPLGLAALGTLSSVVMVGMGLYYIVLGWPA